MHTNKQTTEKIDNRERQLKSIPTGMADDLIIPGDFDAELTHGLQCLTSENCWITNRVVHGF